MSTDMRDQSVGDIVKLAGGQPVTVRRGGNLSAVVDAIGSRASTNNVYVVDGDGRLLGVVTLMAMMKQVGNRMRIRPAGLISWLNYLRDMIARDKVEDYMVPVRAVGSGTPVEEALLTIIESGFTDLPVLDEKGVLVGELNSTEILMRARRILAEGEGADRT